MKPRFTTVVLAVGACAGGIIPVQTFAEEGPGAMEEIVVTATRREQSLQEVPLAVSAMSGEEMVLRGVNALHDIEPGTLPSMEFKRFAGSPSTLTISARGISAPDSPQGTQELPVPVYIDGVYLGRAQGTGVDLIELERVEVLRGPQGQLFGRNAEAGAVQFISRKPTGEFGLRASASIGDYDLQRYKLSLDLPEVAGFSVNLSGLLYDHDPFTKKTDNPQQLFPLAGSVGPQTYVPPEPAKAYGQVDTEGFRVAVRWQSENEKVTVDYAYDDTEQTDTQTYITWTPRLEGTDPTFTNPPSDKFADETFDNQYHKPFETDASGHSLTVAFEATDEITLKYIGSTRKSSRFGGANLGASLVAGLSTSGTIHPQNIEDMKADQDSHEVQFIGLWDQFDLTAGAVYYNEQIDDNRSSQLTGPGLSGGFIIFGPPQSCIDLMLDPCQTVVNQQEAETDSYGIYAQGTYRLMDDRLELIAGARWSDDKKKARRFFEGFGPVDKRNEFKESRVDPAFTVRYQWTDDLSTYIRYATAYRAGGANVRSRDFTNYLEEENETWEIGLKSRFFDNRVQLNVAGYHSTIKGQQRTIQEEPTTNPSLTNTFNADDDLKYKGIEVEAQWFATDELQFGFNMAYLDTDKTYEILDGAGRLTRIWQVSTPKTSGSATAHYVRPLPVGSLEIFGSYSWSDKYAGTGHAHLVSFIEANPNFIEPTISDSEKVHARLGWTDIPVGEGLLSVALWGRNLTDDAGAYFTFNGCALGEGYCAMRSDPRTYGVEVRYEM